MNAAPTNEPITPGSTFAFQQQTIPTYFDNPIVFASFIRKLQRWGFKQVSRRRTGHHQSVEFGSLTFKRLDDERAPAAAAVNICSNAGVGASIQVQQQSTQAFSPLLQQVPAINPMPSQTDANAIPDLISNIQHRRSSQQSVLNQNTNKPNNTDTNSILEGIIGSIPSPHPTLSPLPDNANQLNDVDANIYLELFQEWQHPTQQ